MRLCSQRDIGRFSSPSPLPHTLLPSHSTRSLSARIRRQCTFPCVSSTPKQPGFEGGFELLANISETITNLHPTSFGTALPTFVPVSTANTHFKADQMLWLDNSKVSSHLFSTHNFMFESVSKKPQYSQAENNVFLTTAAVM